MKRWLCSSLLAVLLSGTGLAGALEDRVRELGSDDFQKREAATQALSDAGREAVPLLEKAAQDKDPEVRWRAEKALEAIRARDGKAAPVRPAPRKDLPSAVGEPKPLEPPELGGAVDRAREQLKAVEDGLSRARPELRDFLKYFENQDLNEQLDRILEDLRRQFDAPDRPDAPPLRDFFSFRFNKDGNWEIVRPNDTVGAHLGVRTSPTPPVLRAQLKLEATEPDGVVLEEVRPHGTAAEAGLVRWDLVLSIDGRPVASEADLAVLETPGEHKLALVRGGARVALTATTTAPRAAPAPPRSIPAPEPPAAQKKDELRKY